MAGTNRGATPQFFISDADKEAMVEQLVPQTVFAMERLATEENAPLADDFLDILARAAAAMLAADTNLNTPAKRRLGAETVAAHISRHLERYRAEEAKTGTPAFHRILASYEIPDTLKKAWSDS